MNRCVLLLPILLLSGTSIAKVTYEDALESNQAYYDANEAVNNPTESTGLSPSETDEAGSGDGWVLYFDGSTTDKVSYPAGKYSMIYFQTDKGMFGTYPIEKSVNNLKYASDHNSVSFHSDADCSAYLGYGWVSGCYDSSHGQSAKVTVKKVWLLKI
ncbi:TPA: hypothetical protein ACOL2D_004099 [Vibrio parahaemolyticus]